MQHALLKVLVVLQMLCCSCLLCSCLLAAGYATTYGHIYTMLFWMCIWLFVQED